MARFITKQRELLDDESSTCYEDCRMTDSMDEEEAEQHLQEAEKESLLQLVQSDSHVPLPGQHTHESRFRLLEEVKESQLGNALLPAHHYPHSHDSEVLSDATDGDEELFLPELFSDANDVAVVMEAEIDAAMDAVFEEEEEEELNEGSPMAVFRGYGGLVNLGNTCYMASALQMLATVEEFVDRIREEELPNPDDEPSKKLRVAFLDLMRKLKRGETVRPDVFKQVMDERSPLFVGFEQQDSHEFLTTLLDLIDEDYKRTLNSGESDTKKPLETNETVEDHSTSLGEEDSLAMLAVDPSATKQEPESCRKKARTGEVCDTFITQEFATAASSIAVPTSPTPTGWLSTSCRSSFSELNLDEIGHLLHDSNSSRRESHAYSSSVESYYHPRYKLVGGRMNTADVVLTPYASAVVTDDASSVTSANLEETRMSFTSQHSTPASQQQKSPVDAFFKLSTRVRLTCDSCKFSRCHEESFLHLSLEIGPDCGSVEDGLRRFFSPEKREIKCEKCFSESATQTMEITELPKALLLHFKRFIVEVSSDYASVSYRKNQSMVSFDPKLELDQDAGSVMSEFLAHDCVPPASSRTLLSYGLRSVVNHMGASASCGHYTADACRKYEDGVRMWTRFNDAGVSRISSSDAIENSHRTAYLVLYELE